MTLSTADAKPLPPRAPPRTPLTLAPPAPCRLLCKLRPSCRDFPCQLRVERVEVCLLRLRGPSDGHFPWTELVPASGTLPPSAPKRSMPSAGAVGMSDRGSCPEPAQPQMTSPVDRAAATSCTMPEAVVLLESLVVGEEADMAPRAALSDHAGVTRTRGRPSALFTRSRLDHVDDDRRGGNAAAPAAAAAEPLSRPRPGRSTAGGRAPGALPAAAAAGGLAAVLATTPTPASMSLFSGRGDRFSLLLCFRDSLEGTSLLMSDSLCGRASERAGRQTKTDKQTIGRTGGQTHKGNQYVGVFFWVVGVHG